MKIRTLFCPCGAKDRELDHEQSSIYDSGIEHLICSHEAQGATIAEIGYARTTGKLGEYIATYGPGSTNLITGLADALLDSVPVVAITVG
ncbi:hypothetical protein BG74_06185 [Sodalis-like endosymbiont of Proechinophthirus fluctus]|uniref:thiamine pyrophosphate-binding protein n=1 Tax=Sodalis-like endosymbiont of Proechinophthirus fluctus TaxID=1462730 RepID=UPI0007A8FEBA|nr:hypothetical protein BG74_06185 [Sodalis-like endosymbiont of Proechinophthirus fluctus]